MFDWFPIKKTWVASIGASYRDGERDFVWEFWFQLYIDEEGNKSYGITGRFPSYGSTPIEHARFSTIVFPWLNSDNKEYLIKVWTNADFYNADYWVDYPEITNNTYQHKKKEITRDFKLLQFPKPDEDNKDETPEISA